MTNKVKTKYTFDKNNRGAHPLGTKLKDVHDGQIHVMEVFGGIAGLENEDAINQMLCLNDDELILSGWDKYKQKFIDDGVITQKDIDAEKLNPPTIIKLTQYRDNIMNDTETKKSLNTIRAGLGLTAI